VSPFCLAAAACRATVTIAVQGPVHDREVDPVVGGAGDHPEDSHHPHHFIFENDLVIQIDINSDRVYNRMRKPLLSPEGRWSRVCTGGDGKPGGYSEALAVLASCLDCLRAAAESGEVTEAAYGDVLLGLEAAGTKHAAVRAAFLHRFDAADCHDGDGVRHEVAHDEWMRRLEGRSECGLAA
jgi:hypothetical protein